MSLTLDRILAPVPATTRGEGTKISVDAKSQRIVYASGKSIFVRSIDNPAESKEYTAHTAQTTVARFSPSGFYIASGDVNGNVRIWDAIEAINTKGEYPVISGRINDIAWDGDSQRIIAVGHGRQRFGHCFTADSGNSVGEIIGHSQAINAVAIRPQRPMRAVTVSDDQTVSFYHGPPFRFNQRHKDVHKNFVLATAYAPDGSYFVTTGAEKKIQLYEGKTGELVKELGEGVHKGSIFGVAWSPDSKKIVTASADRTVRVWEVETGKALRVWDLGPEGGRASVPHQQVGVVWPHGRTDGLIISLGLSGNLTYLYENSDAIGRIVAGHNKAITAITPTSDAAARGVSTGSFDGRVCTWDMAKGEATVVEGESHSNQVSGFTHVSGQTLSVGWDDTLRTLDDAAGVFTGQPISLSSQPQAVAASATSKGVYVALASDAIATYDKKGGEGSLLSETKLGYSPSTLDVYGSWVAVGHDTKVHVYQDKSGNGTLEEIKELPAALNAVTRIAFSPDGRHLAIGHATGQIHVYATDKGQWELVTDRWSAHTARVLSIAWNQRGTHAASGGLDNNVFVWSLAQPATRIKALNVHKDGVSGVSWVEGDSKLVSTGGEASLKVWNVSL